MHDMGSGETPGERVGGLNPSFVEVEHDLDVPEGVEGPEPVFVKPEKVVTYENEGVMISSDDVQNPEQTLPAYIKSSHTNDTDTLPVSMSENLEDRMIVEPEQFMIDHQELAPPTR